jgi:serine/threonine protein kinase
MQGQVINGFELKKLLGKGGMAEVWYAENEIGKPAAVKVLNENLASYPQIVERFHNEALVMVKLDHPNIRQVYGYGYIGNRHCIVMEYLEGEDLEALMKNGRRFTDEELRRWWDQTVDALNYTHAMDIVHRDIKPSNLFLDKRGNIKLLDFGIAKVKESISLTSTGAMLGTLMYMSPEQVKDTKNIDYRTDIYSLAVTFAQLISGNCPYDSSSSGDFEIRERIVYKPLDLSGLPASWKNFLAPYLEKEPENRPALRYFGAAMPTPPSDSLTTTIAAGPAPQPQQQSIYDHPTTIRVPETTQTASGTEKPKKKKKVGLWIGLGVGALVVLVVAIVLFLKLREKSLRNEADNQAYQVCVTANDYRSYMRDFGSDALHYNEAKAEVERLVADSTAKAIAEEQARLQAEAEARAKAEAEQIEDKFFENCTSIAACDSYLGAYPQGRYVKEVEAKKAELKKEAEQAAAKKAAQKDAEKKKAAKKQQEPKKASNTKTVKKPNSNKKSGAPKVKINKPGK